MAPHPAVTVLRPSLAEVIDLTATPACVYCDKAALWMGRYTACCHWHLFCDTHRAASIRRHREAVQTAANFWHDCCGMANPDGLRWRRL